METVVLYGNTDIFYVETVLRLVYTFSCSSEFEVN